MAWVTPKTDWKNGDYFNLDPDYNRIKGNIEYLVATGKSLYGSFSAPTLESPTANGYPKATFFNKIFTAIEALLTNCTRPAGSGSFSAISYRGNGRAWDAATLNSIENTLLLLKAAFDAKAEQAPIDDLLENGFDSSTYANIIQMMQLRWKAENWKNPKLAYYLWVWSFFREEGAPNTSYFTVGDEITVPHSVYGDIPFVLIDYDDSTESCTFLSKYAICQKAFDAKEPNNVSPISTGGSSRYQKSNLLQWLNSSADAGQWFVCQDDAGESEVLDTAPSLSYVTKNPYVQERGFLNGLDTVFVNQVQKTSRVTGFQTGQETVDSVKGANATSLPQKFFLLSRTEVGLGQESTGIAEGTAYAYFSGAEQRKATDKTGTGAAWWLRTQAAMNYSKADCIGTSGTLTSNEAYTGTIGVRPAFVLGYSD